MSANDEAASSSKTSNAAAEGTDMDPRLYDAAVNGNIELFQDAARKLDSIVTSNKDTILHINIMSQNRSAKFVEDILDICPSLLRQVNVNDETPLHVAVRYEHLDVVKILTRKDPDFSYSSNKDGETPLYIAAAKNSLEIVVEILETCKSPAYEGPNQMTALHAVAMNFRPDIRRKILEKNKSLIKEIDRYGWTPLHYAAYHYNSMDTLLECDISAAYIGDKHRKMTPLHIAIGRGYIPHKLISRCPDCYEMVDERKWNVLHYAMLSLTYQDLIILLKDPLIRNLINDKNADGNTPLHFLATFRKELLLWKISYMYEDIKLDFGVVNNQHMSVRRVMLNFGTRQQLKPAGPYLDGVVRVKKVHIEPEVDRNKQIEKMKESHLIVAALIATVTFTAAFTLPGGVIQDGDKKGTAILSKKSAFQAFVITDAIAMVLSLSAVFAHFLISLMRLVISTKQSAFLVLYGAYSIMIATGAMVIAFITGTYAVLTTSLWLSILTTFIGFSFFILMPLIVIGLMRVDKRLF